MANWCFNYVTFSGVQSNIEKLYSELKSMAARWEANHGWGILPSFSKLQEGWFFDIMDLTEPCEALHYTTKWNPNLEALKELAQHFKVDFEVQYEELGNLLYGKADYDHAKDELWELQLGNDAFDLYEEIEDASGNYFLFEGKRYDNNCDILDMLLERLEVDIDVAQVNGQVLTDWQQEQELEQRREHWYMQQYVQMSIEDACTQRLTDEP